VKLSVSVPDGDVDFIDRYADEHGVASRSAVVHRALALLRSNELGADYAAAWHEWASSDGELWEPTVADGLAGSAG
jgi:antitoxin MazE9